MPFTMKTDVWLYTDDLVDFRPEYDFHQMAISGDLSKQSTSMKLNGWLVACSTKWRMTVSVAFLSFSGPSLLS